MPIPPILSHISNIISRIPAARKEYHRVNAEYAAGQCDIIGRPTAKARAEDEEARTKWKADKEARLKKKGERTEEDKVGKRRVRRVVHRYESRSESRHKSGGGKMEERGVDEVGRAWEEKIRRFRDGRGSGSGRGRGMERSGSETFISDHHGHIPDMEEGVQDRSEGEAEHPESGQEAHHNGHLPDQREGPRSARGDGGGRHQGSVAAGTGEGNKRLYKRSKPDFLAKVTKRLRKRLRPKQMQKMDVVLEEDEGSVKSGKVREVENVDKDGVREVPRRGEKDSGGNGVNRPRNGGKKDDEDGDESGGGGDDDKMERGEVDHHGAGGWNQAEIPDIPQQLEDEDRGRHHAENTNTLVRATNEDEGGAYEETNNPPNLPEPKSHGENSPYPRYPFISIQSSPSPTRLSEEQDPFTDPGSTIPFSDINDEDSSNDSDSSTDGDENILSRSCRHVHSADSLRVETGRLSLDVEDEK